MTDVVVNHVGLCVSDLGRSRRFYQELFGFELFRELEIPDEAAAKLTGLDAPLRTSICFLRRGRFMLELIHHDAPAHRRPPEPRAMDQPGLSHISIACDVERVCARVEDYGGEVLRETDIGVGIFIRDPDGQRLELSPLSYAERVAAELGSDG